MKNFFFAFFLLLTIISNGQNIFQENVLGPKIVHGYSCVQTNDGGYIATGVTVPMDNDNDDLYLVKTDSIGDILWAKTYSGVENDVGYSVRQTFDNGYIVVGVSTSFNGGYFDIYLIKTNESGDTLWTKTIGGADNDVGYDIKQTSDSGFIIVGETFSYGVGGDIIMIKLDKGGNTIWAKSIGGVNYDRAESVQQTSDKGYIVLGRTESYGAGGSDLFLVKTDSMGSLSWAKTYGGPGYYDFGHSVQQTNDGGYIAAGSTSLGLGGWIDAYIVRTDEYGDTLWTRTYGGSGEDDAKSVLQTSDGGFAFIGYTSSFGHGYEDVYMVRMDSKGDTLWTKTYGGNSGDIGRSFQQTSDSGFIITGDSYSFTPTNSNSLYLIKTDKMGESGCNEQATNTSYFWADGTIVNSVYPSVISASVISKSTASNLGTAGILNKICSSSSIEIKEILTREKMLRIDAYPNPFNDFINVKLIDGANSLGDKSLKTVSFEVKLTDVFGREVKSYKLNSPEFSIYRNNLPAGVYFISITDEIRIIAFEKIIVSN